MYLAVTRMPGESYRTRLRSLLLCLCVTFSKRSFTPLFVDSVFSRGRKGEWNKKYAEDLSALDLS